MKIFTIANNIDGLLTALFVSYTENIRPDCVVDEKFYQPQIGAVSLSVITDKKQGERVKNALYKYGGIDVILHLKICLMSCDINALTTAFNYAYYMLYKRTDVSNDLAQKCVSDFSYTIQKVLHERHTVCDLLRFRLSSRGIMCAQYSPENDITALLAPHFLRRLGHSPFIIYDIKRNVIALSDGKSIKNTTTDLSPSFSTVQKEKVFYEIWRKYYNHTYTKECLNQKQIDYYPIQYRKYCFENWE